MRAPDRVKEAEKLPWRGASSEGAAMATAAKLRITSKSMMTRLGLQDGSESKLEVD